MRLRNPRVQLVIALAVVLIALSVFSYSKIGLKQTSVEPAVVTAPTNTHQDPPPVSEALRRRQSEIKNTYTYQSNMTLL